MSEINASAIENQIDHSASVDPVVTMKQSELNKLVGSVRAKGYERGLQQSSFPVDPEYAYTAGNQQKQKALTEEAAQQLFDRKLAEAQERAQRDQEAQRQRTEQQNWESYKQEVNNKLARQAMQYKDEMNQMVDKISLQNGFQDDYLFPVKCLASDFPNGIEMLAHLAEDESLLSNIANKGARLEWMKKDLEKLSKQLIAERESRSKSEPNLASGNIKSSPSLSKSSGKAGAPDWSQFRGKYRR